MKSTSSHTQLKGLGWLALCSSRKKDKSTSLITPLLGYCKQALFHMYLDSRIIDVQNLAIHVKKVFLWLEEI